MTRVRTPSFFPAMARAAAAASTPGDGPAGADGGMASAGEPGVAETPGHHTACRRGRLLQRLSAWDRAASRLVGVRLPHPPRLTRALGLISRSGDHGYIWYAMAAAPLIARRPRGAARFAYVAGGVFAGEMANFAVKMAVRRQRPSQAPADGGHYIKLPATHSFPSAHATMGMMGLATMGRLYPRIKGPLVALVALLAFTRAYLRVHYPADVAVGLGMGALAAAVYTRLVRLPRPPHDARADGGHS